MRAVTTVLMSMAIIVFGQIPTGAAVDDDPEEIGPSSQAEGYVTEEDSGSFAGSGVSIFESVAEYVHLNLEPRRHVSGHGCWRTSDPDLVDELATITVVLQVWDIDGEDWDIVEANSKEDLRPGCGRGKRATAKELCSSSTLRTWRSRVDVDIQGMIDSNEKVWSPNRRLYCSP